MSEWPFTYGSGGDIASLGLDLTASGGQNFTAGGSVNTKAGWVQLGSSTLPRHAKGCIVSIGGHGGSGPSLSVDIGIGTAGNEKVLYADIGHGLDGSGNFNTDLYLPCELPAGTQINVRGQSTTASYAYACRCIFLYNGFLSEQMGNTCTTYGMTTSGATHGTSVDGGAANTWGSWTTIASSTTYHHKGLVIYQTDNVLVTPATGNTLHELAVGTAGNEKILIKQLAGCVQGTTERHFGGFATGRPFACNIPAGSTLRMRMQGDQSSSMLSEWSIIGIS